MKNIMTNTLIALSLATSLSLSLHAEENKGDHPCNKIKTACESAGFVKNGHKQKKGLQLDCIKPILKGKSVEGVTVAPEDVAACNAKRIKRAEKRSEKNEVKKEEAKDLRN
ncbi:MAG: hypothetical protein ACXVLQ_14245 [Bacteriovorax sp.]